MKLFAFLELCIYFALIPIIFKLLLAVDLNKIFKKDRVFEIRALFIIISIIVAKLVGDFFISIMDYIRLLFDLLP